jgi:hypothetical protein
MTTAAVTAAAAAVAVAVAAVDSAAAIVAAVRVRPAISTAPVPRATSTPRARRVTPNRPRPTLPALRRCAAGAVPRATTTTKRVANIDNGAMTKGPQQCGP